MSHSSSLTSSLAFLSPAEAARSLGVSAKALRLWEERGLIAPGRTAAGWRAYGPEEMARAREIAALRALGLSLAQVERVMGGEPAGLEAALAAQQTMLEAKARETTEAIGRVREMRTRIAGGARPNAVELAGLECGEEEVVASFDLPWPWGGERLELRGLRPLTWIVGPLFSGKTKLAMKIAETLPGGTFFGLERTADQGAAMRARVARALAWLMEDGARESDALLAVLVALEADGTGPLVFDLIEQGLDEGTQLALAAWLRARGAQARPVFAMTRSSAMLDLAAVTADEAIIFCPANHSPPVFVSPWPGAPGHEALASCLGAPDVRARTEGVVAVRPPAA